MTHTNQKQPRYLRAIIGGLVGGVLGYLAFFMLVQSGIYGMVIPGALVGLGCGAQAGAKSWGLGIFAGALALAVSVFLEWHFFPFSEDHSFSFFIANLDGLPRLTKFMLAAGTFAGFWFGRGR